MFLPVRLTSLEMNGRPHRRAFGEYPFMDGPGYRPSSPAPREDHKRSESFARVYANPLASHGMSPGKVQFPVGSVIVREKLLRHDSTEPELVTAMFKRARGFSPRTGDWEFFIIDRGMKRVKDRETTGNCAACHANAKETDWVYKTYLH